VVQCEVITAIDNRSQITEIFKILITH